MEVEGFKTKYLISNGTSSIKPNTDAFHFQDIHIIPVHPVILIPTTQAQCSQEQNTPSNTQKNAHLQKISTMIAENWKIIPIQP